MDRSPPVIRAEGLARSFGGAPVLGGIDLVVEPGETIALLGPNGAGKTTLLRMLALLLRPTGGRLALFGVDAQGAPASLRRRLGYLGHESFCYPDLTGPENLTFQARLFGLDGAAGRVRDLLTWAGLEHVATRPVRFYSRGMLQRLALARALLHEPDLLLLDEPFSGLDPEAAAALEERLAALRLAGRAIILTTHDLERAAPLATRTAVLHRGRIAWLSEGERAPGAVAAAYRAMVGSR